jgi:hypothetical protein
MEQKFGTKKLGYEVIHRAARHNRVQTEAHKVREAKKRKDQQYLVARAIEKHWWNKEADIAVALKTLGGVSLERFGAIVKLLCQAPDSEVKWKPKTFKSVDTRYAVLSVGK